MIPIPSPIIPNDEPTIFDDLGDSHDIFVQELAELVKNCRPPYVIGVHGSWGSGKTSILEKLWMYLCGEPHRENAGEDDAGKWCRKHFPDYYNREVLNKNILPKYATYPKALKKALSSHTNKFQGLELVWFSPWRFQFEDNPTVALLQEIRSHFSLKQKLKGESKKLFDVLIYTSLHIVDELSNIVQTAEKRGKEYERNNYEMRLFSQHFQETLQKAIGDLLHSIGKNKLVVFIDDLDRCRPDRAFKLIEGFKLYLGANNCIFVMAMDRKVIEEAIRKEKSGNTDKEDLPVVTLLEAREYLEKIVQTSLLVPRPVSIDDYVAHLLTQEKQVVQLLGRKWFNKCLPHNPRKIKSFITSYRLYLRMLDAQFVRYGLDKTSLNIEYAAVLCYLAHFEEEIYRAVERDPEYFETILIPPQKP